MFIGHYAAAFAARAAKPSIPLWQLFVAVQLVDFAWAGLVLAGIEKFRIAPGFMEASILDLHHMPYTHSLLAACLWALGAGVLYALLWRGQRRAAAGLILALAVFSHWLTDLIVHAPDLALYPGGMKVGFGLWNSLVWSQVVEIGGLIICGLIYIGHVRPKGPWGRAAPWLLLASMIALHVSNHLPTNHPPPVNQFAIMALLAFILLAGLAWITDRLQTPV